ncbi:MAG TPA: UPF0182 family protein [Vicinamibacterales bacterium]|nr:UPF0182 family protein [Vicinamibacterales bacterium]
MRVSLRFTVIVVLALLFFGAPSLIRFYTDWLWFGEVGYQEVFTTIVRSQASLFTITFVIAVLWLVFNLRLALGSMREGQPIFTTQQGIEVALPGRQQLRTIASAIAMILAALIGLYASSQWETWVLWRNAAPFAQQDPILGYDIGFYVFSIPFLQFVRGIGQTLVIMAALGAGAIYALSGMFPTGPFSVLSMTPTMRRHIALLVAVFFLLVAGGAWLGRLELLAHPAGIIYGASYADVHARMPVALALTVVSILGAVLAVIHGLTRRNWPIPVAIGLYLLVSLGGEAYATLLQRFVVTPNEQARESPFIRHNIDATRRAFALDRVDERGLTGDAVLTRDDIARNAPTLQNIRLWDHQPLLDTFGQLQEIRTYYDFVSVDNDRYVINGRPQQVMLSARELNSNSLPNRTWVNERLTFTHGYGLTLGPVNQVTTEGLPVLWVRNLPTETIPDLPISEPSLYFGELSNDYVIVRTRTREFHYPRGDENVFTQYSGSGGLALESLGRRIMFALRFGAYQIAFNDDITGESRILFHRNIAERVQEIAPFLTFDRDPYLVLADGRPYWMYDAYTTSNRYPYSTPAGGVNYIRNSVKIVIDAFNGTTIFYAADPRDPVLATYANVFAGMFKPLAEMPATLRSHIRYPEDMFALQASVFATYHMTEPAVFYNREDQWEVPTIDDSGEAQAAMQPYYTIMRLPGEADAEFIQMLPFTPRRKDNLAAWLVARSDGDHYGEVRVFEFPKQKVVFGPRQVVARINQDQMISPQITLWNQQGSQVTWGTLMVIPIEESLIYVRPLYLRGAGGRIPELTRVVVVYQDQIIMEQTLEGALARLFGGGAPARVPPTTSTSTSAQPQAPVTTPAVPAPTIAASPQFAALAEEAQAHYQRAIDAQRAGDWAKYGEEIRALGQTLDRMKQR